MTKAHQRSRRAHGGERLAAAGAAGNASAKPASATAERRKGTKPASLKPSRRSEPPPRSSSSPYEADDVLVPSPHPPASEGAPVMSKSKSSGAAVASKQAPSSGADASIDDDFEPVPSIGPSGPSSTIDLVDDEFDLEAHALAARGDSDSLAPPKAASDKEI